MLITCIDYSCSRVYYNTRVLNLPTYFYSVRKKAVLSHSHIRCENKLILLENSLEEKRKQWTYTFRYSLFRNVI